MNIKIEYRVRPITRYVVTRYYEEGADGKSTGTVTQRGEYDNADVAFEVGYALCKAEHERLGFPPGDMRIMYPEHPRTVCVPVTGLQNDGHGVGGETMKVAFS